MEGFRVGGHCYLGYPDINFSFFFLSKIYLKGIKKEEEGMEGRIETDKGFSPIGLPLKCCNIQVWLGQNLMSRTPSKSPHLRRRYLNYYLLSPMMLQQGAGLKAEQLRNEPAVIANSSHCTMMLAPRPSLECSLGQNLLFSCFLLGELRYISVF